MEKYKTKSLKIVLKSTDEKMIEYSLEQLILTIINTNSQVVGPFVEESIDSDEGFELVNKINVRSLVIVEPKLETTEAFEKMIMPVGVDIVFVQINN